jgi:hypothetical protein
MRSRREGARTGDGLMWSRTRHPLPCLRLSLLSVRPSPSAFLPVSVCLFLCGLFPLFGRDPSGPPVLAVLLASTQPTHFQRTPHSRTTQERLDTAATTVPRISRRFAFLLLRSRADGVEWALLLA